MLCQRGVGYSSTHMQGKNVVSGHKGLITGWLTVVEPLYLVPLAPFQPLMLPFFSYIKMVMKISTETVK